MQLRDYHRNMQQVMGAANSDADANIKRHLDNLEKEKTGDSDKVQGTLEKIDVKFGERIPADDEHKEE